MEFELQKSVFLPALQAVAAVAPGRHAREIYTHVLLSLDKGRLSLSATDGEISIRRTLQVEGLDSVSVVKLIPPQRLLAILRESSDDSIAFRVEDVSITVKVGTSVFTLQVLGSPEEFPDLAESDVASHWQIESHRLLALFRTA